MNAIDRALNIVMHGKLCAHEAGHAASALIGGLDVREVRADFHDVTVEPANPDEAAGHVLWAAVDRDDPAELREHAIAVLAGPMAEDSPRWPPKWPLLAPVTHDERDLGEAVARLGLDEKGYGQLVGDAYKRITSHEFDRLHMGVRELLEGGHTLDGHTLAELHKIAATAGMERVTYKAVATETDVDLGQFTAVISTAAVDRERDVVVPQAMVAALQAWNRPIPLAWNHSTAADDIFGEIHPQSVKAVGDEVVADGQVDLDTERGRQAWRLMKRRSIAFSFGYMVVDAVKRADGVREIHRLDVFEISTVPIPANNGTRVVDTKAIEDDDPDRTPTHAELERQLIDMGIITTPADAEQYRQADPVMAGDGPNGNSETKCYDHVRTKWRDDMIALATADAETKAIERKATAPVQVATFEC